MLEAGALPLESLLSNIVESGTFWRHLLAGNIVFDPPPHVWNFLIIKSCFLKVFIFN